ncbi:ATP-binding protein, partial [Candidatus Bathyarchaeota archaeon]|nr:ATP-binding protein [Candidatus Bathyarchaeota archaeon]
LEWFKRYSPEELVWVYASFGGTPAYLEHVDEAESVEENIVQKILSKRAPLHDEPEMLLMEELRTPQRYMDILSAISQGKNTMSEIADAAGLSRENTTTYLKMLEVLDLIERVTPITDPEAKKGIYRIKDPFFAFWFGFVRPNKRQLELGLERNVWESIKEEFKTHLGRVFEDICAEAVAEMAKKGYLPMKVSKVGKWWWKDYEIDIVGLMGRKALAIEAKWKELNLQEARRLLYQLSHKAQHIHGVDEHVLGVMAKKIEDKQRIIDEGFIALDLQDIAHFAKQKAASSRVSMA